MRSGRAGSPGWLTISHTLSSASSSTSASTQTSATCQADGVQVRSKPLYRRWLLPASQGQRCSWNLLSRSASRLACLLCERKLALVATDATKSASIKARGLLPTHSVLKPAWQRRAECLRAQDAARHAARRQAEAVGARHHDAARGVASLRPIQQAARAHLCTDTLLNAGACNLGAACYGPHVHEGVMRPCRLSTKTAVWLSAEWHATLRGKVCSYAYVYIHSSKHRCTATGCQA